MNKIKNLLLSKNPVNIGLARQLAQGQNLMTEFDAMLESAAVLANVIDCVAGEFVPRNFKVPYTPDTLLDDEIANKAIQKATIPLPRLLDWSLQAYKAPLEKRFLACHFELSYKGDLVEHYQAPTLLKALNQPSDSTFKNLIYQISRFSRYYNFIGGELHYRDTNTSKSVEEYKKAKGLDGYQFLFGWESYGIRDWDGYAFNDNGVFVYGSV